MTAVHRAFAIAVNAGRKTATATTTASAPTAIDVRAARSRLDTGVAAALGIAGTIASTRAVRSRLVIPTKEGPPFHATDVGGDDENRERGLRSDRMDY